MIDTRQLGKSDLNISPIVLGTWALGGWLWGGTEKNDAKTAINNAIDNGINMVDTAPVYGFGLSEELVGEALKDRRDEVYIATKCGLVWDDRPGTTLFFETKDNQGRDLGVFKCLRKKSILAECDESLRRLRVDVIDLYQCHWPDPGTDLDETMDAMQVLKDRGKIREIGVSNFSLEQLMETTEYVSLASNQPKYNLLTRDIEDEILPFCREKEVGTICYSPMEMGLLTGKIKQDHVFPENDTRLTRPWFQAPKRAEVLKALDKIKPLTEKYDCELAHLAISWVVSQPGITAAIVGARNGEQALSNAKAAKLSISSEDLEMISDVFKKLELDEPYDLSNAKR